MENRTAPRFVLLLALMFSPVAFGAGKLKADPYTEAVAEYVEAARVQLGAIRESVNASLAEAGDDVKQRYVDAVRRLDVCDGFVRRLKVASQKEFDPLKSEFEKTRAEMMKSLEAARKAL